MKESRKLSTILNGYSKSVASIINDSSILNELKDFGVDSRYVSKGLHLLNEAKSVIKSLSSNTESQVLTQSYFVKAENAQRRYCGYVKRLSKSVHSTPELLKIIPPEIDSISPFETLQTAFIFYSNLRLMPKNAAEIVAEAGLTTRKLENEMALLGEIGYLKMIRYQALGDDAEMIMARDRVIEEFLAYCKDLQAITHLALTRKQHLYPKLSMLLS